MSTVVVSTSDSQYFDLSWAARNCNSASNLILWPFGFCTLDSSLIKARITSSSRKACYNRWHSVRDARCDRSVSKAISHTSPALCQQKLVPVSILSIDRSTPYIHASRSSVDPTCFCHRTSSLHRSDFESSIRWRLCANGSRCEYPNLATLHFCPGGDPGYKSLQHKSEFNTKTTCWK